MLLKALCVLFLATAAFGIVMEKRNPHMWWTVRGSSNYIPTVTDGKDIVSDGNWSTWYATAYEQYPQMRFSLDWPIWIDMIEIVNRQDCCQERLSPFYVFIGDASYSHETPEQIMAMTDPTLVRPFQYVYVDEVKSVYQLPASGIWQAAGKILQANTNWMNIAEFNLYSFPLVVYTEIYSSTIYGGGVSPTSQAVDKKLLTWFHSAEEPNSNPWLELRFAAQRICQVNVWNRMETCCSARLSPNRVGLKNGAFTYRAPSLTLADSFCSLETGVSCSATQTGVKQVYVHEFPDGPMADRVRIFQLNPTWMNVAEVKVYACSFSDLSDPRPEPTRE